MCFVSEHEEETTHLPLKSNTTTTIQKKTVMYSITQKILPPKYIYKLLDDIFGVFFWRTTSRLLIHSLFRSRKTNVMYQYSIAAAAGQQQWEGEYGAMVHVATQPRSQWWCTGALRRTKPKLSNYTWRQHQSRRPRHIHLAPQPNRSSITLTWTKRVAGSRRRR